MRVLGKTGDVAGKIDAVEIDEMKTPERPEFSVCTFVTDKNQYAGMLASFRNAGFGDDCCEYLYIDNTDSNKYSAYSGIHRFFRSAGGRYLIVCHQDIRLDFDHIDDLRRIIREMNRYDPDWAILGNAGGAAPGKIVVRITDRHYGKDAKIGHFPARVSSLDENFILVRTDAGIGISHDLSGFHMYGTDLCQIASVLGYSAYVVDFHLRHIGGESFGQIGKKTDESPDGLYGIRSELIRKYTRAFRPRWIQSTCTVVHISGSSLRNFWANRKFIYSIRKRLHRWGILKTGND